MGMMQLLKASRVAQAQKVTGELVKKKRSPSAKKKPQGKRLLKKNKRAGKNSKNKNVLVKESIPMLLIELLPKELVKLVLDHLSDDTCSIIIYAHNWLPEDISRVVAEDVLALCVLSNEKKISPFDRQRRNFAS